MKGLPTQIQSEFIVRFNGTYVRLIRTVFGNYYTQEKDGSILPLKREIAATIILEQQNPY